MQWIPTSNAGPTHSWALKDGQTVAELKFSLESKTLRLFASEIRQFFLESSRWHQHRIIITSEYGILLGELQYFKHSQGSLYLNQQKYFYTENDKGFYLMDSLKQPVMECNIETGNELTIFEFAALVFGLVWVVQQMDLTKAPIREKLFN